MRPFKFASAWCAGLLGLTAVALQTGATTPHSAGGSDWVDPSRPGLVQQFAAAPFMGRTHSKARAALPTDGSTHGSAGSVVLASDGQPKRESHDVVASNSDGGTHASGTGVTRVSRGRPPVTDPGVPKPPDRNPPKDRGGNPPPPPDPIPAPTPVPVPAPTPEPEPEPSPVITVPPLPLPGRPDPFLGPKLPLGPPL